MSTFEEQYRKYSTSRHGNTWMSDIDNNVWQPDVYGWTELGTTE